MSRILIAEDEARIAAFLEKGLRANGFSTMTVDGVDDVLAATAGSDFDLLILDLGLRDGDGMQALTELRKRGNRLPVVILTARDSVAERVAGLQAGADDYVTKPFSFEELLARIRLRRRPNADMEPTVITVGRVTLDLRTRRAAINGNSFELTAREFALLETFIRHPDQVLSREQLLSHVWGYDFDPGSNVVDSYVRYLRNKLGPNSIETVRRMGYRLRVAPE